MLSNAPYNQSIMYSEIYMIYKIWMKSTCFNIITEQMAFLSPLPNPDYSSLIPVNLIYLWSYFTPCIQRSGNKMRYNSMSKQLDSLYLPSFNERQHSPRCIYHMSCVPFNIWIYLYKRKYWNKNYMQSKSWVEQNNMIIT